VLPPLPPVDDPPLPPWPLPSSAGLQAERVAEAANAKASKVALFFEISPQERPDVWDRVFDGSMFITSGREKCLHLRKNNHVSAR
jgi:hypothetical protein